MLELRIIQKIILSFEFVIDTQSASIECDRNAKQRTTVVANFIEGRWPSSSKVAASATTTNIAVFRREVATLAKHSHVPCKYFAVLN